MKKAIKVFMQLLPKGGSNKKQPTGATFFTQFHWSPARLASHKETNLSPHHPLNTTQRDAFEFLSILTGETMAVTLHCLNSA